MLAPTPLNAQQAPVSCPSESHTSPGMLPALPPASLPNNLPRGSCKLPANFVCQGPASLQGPGFSPAEMTSQRAECMPRGPIMGISAVRAIAPAALELHAAQLQADTAQAVLH